MGKVHMTLVTVLKLVINTSMSIKQASKTTSFLMLVTAFGHRKSAHKNLKNNFFSKISSILCKLMHITSYILSNLKSC